MNKRTYLLMAVGGMLVSQASAKSLLQSLKVEYLSKPLAVSVQHPRFAWQMTADDALRGWRQNAYQITVTDEQGKLVWNSGKVKSDLSLGISYDGEALRPSTRYQWNLKVWNQKNEELNDSSFFETALVMAPDYNHSIYSPSASKAIASSTAASTPVASSSAASSAAEEAMRAWQGAKWIGRAKDAVMFYAPYFPIFRLCYDVQLDKKSKSTAASFVFGANDPRLMDRNKNLLAVAAAKDSSYLRLELNIAPLKQHHPALLCIYRKGYKAGEQQEVLVDKREISADIISEANKYDAHHVSIAVNAGACSLLIDGKVIIPEQEQMDTDGIKKTFGSLVLNPTGEQGNNYIAYPMVADLGYQLHPKQKATFRNVEVRSYRNPQHVVARLNDASMDGGKQGTLRTFALKENAAPMLRTTFSTQQGKRIKKARLYATARGIYDFYINGKQVSPAYFNPGTTQYERTHLYQTFDVTSLLQETAKNAIGAILSEGWWSGAATYVTGNWNLFGDKQSLLAKLQITYDDGTEQNIVTDPKTWKTYDDGAVRYGSFFMGEVYDAQKAEAQKDWATPSYDDSQWQPATELNYGSTTKRSNEIDPKASDGNFLLASDYQMLADMAQPILPIDTLTAQSLLQPRAGVYVYDMGQNMAGVPLIHFSGLKPGTEVKIRTAEVKYPDLPRYGDNIGMIMTENLRVATSQDIYIAKGGEETFSPRFTLHGYRYLEITGIDTPVRKEDVKAIVVSSMNVNASLYQTSRPDINRLWQNAMWSTRANFMSVPTDCPQRNERLGWMGDISVFSRSATYITDASQFLRRYLISVRDLQSVEGQYPDVAPTNCGFGGLLWASAGITLPWEMYQQYGDKAMLQEHYPSMKRYIQFVQDHYLDKDGLIVQHHEWGDLGDWLSPSYDQDDKSLTWECYFIFDLDIMQRLATALGYTADAEHYARLAAERRAFFLKTYVDPATKRTIFSGYEPSKKGKLVDTQTSYALPLALNVVEGDTRTAMAEHLKEAVSRSTTTEVANSSTKQYPAYSLLTGFIGTAWISKALSDNGMSDLAYRMLEQDTYPSWLYPVKNGATSIWERLDSYTIENGFGENNSMNSFNHYSFGSVSAWMYNYSLGIRRDEQSPAFKHFFLQPEVDSTGGITHAEGYYDSMYGRIESSWRASDKSSVAYRFVVPANTSATLLLPAPSKSSITEGGKPLGKQLGIKYLGMEKGLHKMELQSGTYRILIKN